MIVYVMKKVGGNKNYPDSLNIMGNYHYDSENRLITWQLQSMTAYRDIFCINIPGLYIHVDICQSSVLKNVLIYTQIFAE